MKKINWGIIGCGDVTEVKSGPAFNKVADSALVAVMRRDAGKAADYAKRHQVPAWYADANQLINDPAVNAIYVATPPGSHESYVLAAIDAGKSVYVEKPMALNFSAADNMRRYAGLNNAKLTVAHYRRAQPLYQKIKQLLDEKAIGDTRLVKLDYFTTALSEEELTLPKTAWRVDPAISGGGLFNDLAPHQIDLVYYFSAKWNVLRAFQQTRRNGIKRMTSFPEIYFKNGVAFNGTWYFNAAPGEERDHCEIIGSKGSIGFSIFNAAPVTLTRSGKKESYQFDALPHVQQPMIERVVAYFLGKEDNPCTAGDGAGVMKIMEAFTDKP